MGRRRHHSKGGNKQQGVQDTSTDQNQSLNKSSTLESNNVSNGNEKSAFEVLKAAKLQQNESIMNGKGPISTSTPLASDVCFILLPTFQFRRKQRANDGSGAARVPIGTKPQPQKSVTEKKEKSDVSSRNLSEF
ncbi:unnamed protein product [Anisakis simplex]|uniref:Uncharacterized protein n=1 Tax=Anisakis simplex TaxID=6269 RepID=A0A0M3J8J3_ANISI|nr:unnamed protein product [Anisakis simplex]